MPRTRLSLARELRSMTAHRRRVWATLALVLAVGVLVSRSTGVPLPRPSVVALAAASQPAHEPAASGEVAEQGHDTAEEEHSTMTDTIARLVNFGILAGVLFMLLRTPVVAHLRDRGAQVRADLANARATTASATQQLREIDEKLRALPDELEALRLRGQQDAAAEEVRLRQSTDVERQRLLDQGRREADLQLHVAKQDLVRHAAELAVDAASNRIKDNLTEVDQLRLIDRYVGQVSAE